MYDAVTVAAFGGVVLELPKGNGFGLPERPRFGPLKLRGWTCPVAFAFWRGW